MRTARAACLAACLAALAIGPAYAGTNHTAKCDVHALPCLAVTGSGMAVEFSIGPRPVHVMEDLEFTVKLSRKGNPVAGAALVLDLSMPGMFMGSNQPKLKEQQGGHYRGHGVIPRCVTGQKTWKAFIAVAHGGRVENVAFLFEVR